MLDKLDKAYQRGPYIVSVVKAPLSEQTEAVQPYLVQDFTGKVPELISQVFDLFTSRAAQQTKWIADDSFRSFWLDLRNLAAIVGNAVPDVVGRTMIILNRASHPQEGTHSHAFVRHYRKGPSKPPVYFGFNP